MMFGGNLLETIVGGVAAMAISFLGGMVYDDLYGRNAWKLAAIKAELAKTNSVLEHLQREDAETAAREKAEDERRQAEFSALTPNLKKCVLDSDQVAALNKLMGGP